MSNLSRWWSRLFLIIGPGIYWVQAQAYQTSNLSLAQGLPEYFVSGLAQDKAGFIWVATRDGLARYDGHNFKIFRHQPNQPNSLAYNIILYLQPVSDSTLVLYLENGAHQLFNPITHQFKSLLQQSPPTDAPFGWQLSPDQRQIWGRFGTGLATIDRHTNQTRFYSIANFSPPGTAPVGLPFLATNHHRLYAAVTGGLIELDTRTQQYHRWSHEAIGEWKQKQTYYAVPMTQRSTGELIIGGIHQLVTFNPTTHRFRSIPIPSPLDTQVSLVYTAGDGNIYFSYGMTLYRLSPDDQITPLWTAPRTDYLNYFRSILVDRSGVCWIGTNGDGIQQVDLRSLPFKAYAYKKDFAYDLLTLELGFPPQTWTHRDLCYRLRFAGTAPYMILWNWDNFKLMKGDQQRHRFQTILTMHPDEPSASGRALCVLPNGQLQLYGNNYGVIQTDSLGHLLQTFPIVVKTVTDLQPIGEQIWVATEKYGLYVYNWRQKRMTHLHHQPTDPHSLRSNNVQCLIVDPTDPAVLWIGLLGSGLCRLNTRTMHYQYITEKEGLPNATIQALLADRSGQLWLSTLKGISRLDPTTGQMRHFTIEDGLQDIEYKLHHAAQLPDGRMAFGGLIGMTVFDPLTIDDDSFEVPTGLVSLKVNNRPVEAGQMGSPLLLPLNSTQTLTLKHNQNFLTFDFAGLQFNKPGKLQYRYQLIGVDEGWVYAGGQNSANYTQLAPGTYEFNVNATNTAGRWSPLVKTLRVVITPPAWATGWAYSLYILTLAGLAWLFMRAYANRSQLRQQIAFRQQEAQQLRMLDELKTQFFTNITHELRTPLTLILAPLEKLLDDVDISRFDKPLKLAHRNAQQLMNLINQLLDLAQLDAQFIKVQLSRGNLAQFVEEILDPFAQQASAQGLLFRIHNSTEGDYWFDRDKLERILTNLVGNAFKFTRQGGEITVTLGPEQAGIDLSVADTGIGIAAEHLSHIFDRFYRVDQAETYPVHKADSQPLSPSTPNGSGIGLALVHELVLLQQGQITVQSQVGQGTTFRVYLPYQPAQTAPASLLVQADSSSPVEPKDSEAPRLLLVEDNQELAEFIADCLPSPYIIDRASNGHVGLQLALQHIPDLILSDVMMPGLDGYTLVQHLKEDARTNHIPVILLTAKASFDHRLEGLTKGADDYLTKPFHVGELRLRVENLLSRQRRLQERLSALLRQPQATLEATPSSADQNPFLLRTYDFLDQHLADSTLSVEDLANHLHLERSSLHRKIKALMGMSPNELIRAYRLKQAAHRLSQGLTSSETAYQTGFDSPAYFAKCFREQYGMTPSEFAQKASKRTV